MRWCAATPGPPCTGRPRISTISPPINPDPPTPPRGPMKLLAALATCALTTFALATPAHSRSLIIEDSTPIENPDPARYPQFGFDVATNGQYACVAASDASLFSDVLNYYVLLYRRVNGQWTLQRELAHATTSNEYFYPMELVMQGNLAAIGMAGGVTAYHL